MFNKRLAGGALALTLALAACGTNTAAVPEAGPADQLAAAPVDTTPNEEAGAATPIPAAADGPATFLGATSLGNILIGPDGRTLYGFTNDTEAKSTCYDRCAEAWPPVIVDQSWTVGPGLDLGIFATTVRDDGTLQLVAGKWPLYYYFEDERPGDITGQGSGDVWFAVDPDGILVTSSATGDGAQAAADPDGDAVYDDGAPGGEDESAITLDGGNGTGLVIGGGSGDDNPETGEQSAVLRTGETELGTVLVDDDGLTLYGFTNDMNGVPSCEDGCAQAWPPLIVEQLPAGLDPELFSVAARPDGTLQLVAGMWPLYRFAGDAVPGDVNGQRSGDVWFAVSPDGALIKS